MDSPDCDLGVSDWRVRCCTISGWTATVSLVYSRVTRSGCLVWLDALSRSLIRSGQLERFIDTDGLSGITSNPAIFAKAIHGSKYYETDIRRFSDRGMTASEIYEELVVKDIQDAADLLLPIYERTGGIDGYVSLEVSPLLAHQTKETVDEAKRLWIAVSRPNIMIKIPATREGLLAITACTVDGLNINVTLLFGLARYREVAEAYINGLEQRARRNQDLRTIRSVASFFLSRIDVLIDGKLHDFAENQPLRREAAQELHGSVAIASAKLAYQMYRDIFNTDTFRRLEQLGARKQWLLWGSTSTKSKEFSDVKYVEPLIGPETINTMPIETIAAYRDHGAPALTLEQDVTAARETMTKLAQVGIDIDQVTQKLEDEGVDKFVKPFEDLIQELMQRVTITTS
jgi:transaldolase